MTKPKRDRGPRWSSPKQADRGSPLRSFSLEADVHNLLDDAKRRGRNMSADVNVAIRAFYAAQAEAPEGTEEQSARARLAETPRDTLRR